MNNITRQERQYLVLASEIDRLLKQISKELNDNQPSGVVSNVITWADCGTLSYIKDHLTEIVNFLTGEEDE